MVVTDPIADMLTRIRNANLIKQSSVLIPLSKLKVEILKVLYNEGYVGDYTINLETNYIEVALKYTKDKQRVINGLKRISKPGLKVYASVNELPRVLGGLGIAIISTSKGILTDKQARDAKVGGEVLAYVW